MGKFADKKKEIYASSLNKDGKIRRTSNRRQFDELGTALLNDPDYKEVVKRTHGGKTTEVETTPVADLRKAMIGGIAKGHPNERELEKARAFYVHMQETGGKGENT